MSRLSRSLGALLVLVGALVGVPLALLALGGSLVPAHLSWSVVVRVLTRPDDGSVVLGLITVIGWLAWAVFALSVLTELVTVLSRSRVRIRLPGLAGPQRLAAGLILAVLALSAAPAVSSSVLVAPAAQAAPAQPASPASSGAASPMKAAPLATAEKPQVHRRTHVVERGDDLWSLAQHYYGDGQQWRVIARANPALLTGGPDRLTPGWRLAVPEIEAADGSPGGRTVTVRAGETLSVIAQRELGSASRWSEIYQLNRAQLDDPDELVAGIRLSLPGRPAPSHTETPPPPAAPDPSAPPSEPAHAPTPVPSTAPTAPAPAPTGPTASAPPVPAPAAPAAEQANAVLPLAGVGGALAAGLVAGLAYRRRLQLQARPVGRRIVHPPAATRPIEVALGRRQRPLTLRTLDQALRALGAYCRTQQVPLPALRLVLLGEQQLELVMAEAGLPAPVPFRVEGRSWLLDAEDAGYLRSVPGAGEALRPWPALVTLGRDADDRQVLVDLEGLGQLQLEGGEEQTSGVLAALAVELSFSPWAEELTVTVVGGPGRLPAALGSHGVTRTQDLDAVLARLGRRAAEQRRHQPAPVLGRHRLDPDLADPWTPEVVLVNQPVTAEQSRRLRQIVGDQPRVTVAAVTVGHEADPSWSLRWRDGDAEATLLPMGLRLAPSHLEPDEEDAVRQLVETTGSTDTTPAPWWSSEAERRQVSEPEPPPDNVTYLGRRYREIAEGEGEDEVAAQAAGRVDGTDALDHPTLLLLGPVELLGVAGVAPPRAGRQCLEYCAWLLEHPGRTAQSMASALAVAEGTRRSNMSRLRSWLGDGVDGKAYLPDAYSGRILLHPAVSSDWQRLQILVGTGIDRSSTEALQAALQLVRGAPLADAAPGQWHWAEELRTDMVSCVRDVGVELTRRALGQHDLDLARWAASRALVAAPGDEQLLASRIRTEHQAGNTAETERLSLQLAAQARRLGVDLDEQTVVLLQEVVEGQVRARMA